jgi:hypothetical protein
MRLADSPRSAVDTEPLAAEPTSGTGDHRTTAESLTVGCTASAVAIPEARSVYPKPILLHL